MFPTIFEQSTNCKAGNLTLCGVCSNLDPNVVRIDEWQGLPGITISHHDSLAVLEQSARDGCDMCRMMHNHILYEDYTVFEDNRLYIYPVKLWRTGLALFVRCNFLEAVIYDFYSSQEDLVKFPMELTYLLRFPKVYPSSYGPTVEQKFQLITQWIINCTTDHEECRAFHPSSLPSLSSGFFPTRVINVGPKDGSKEPFLFVPSREWLEDPTRRYLSISDPAAARYTALSYCWGEKQQPFITTKENFRQMEHGILISGLPKTLQDAVSITRRLGVQYLWVDAICIIQDDPADWGEECGKMANVYRHALCTIAATSGRDVDAGCFIDRVGVQVHETEKYINSHLEANDDDQTKPVCSPSWGISVLNAPLNKRGWVLQERALSSRILHWTEDALFWECNTVKASEFQPSDTISHRSKTATLDDEPLIYESDMRRLTPEDCTSWAWWGLLQNYSRRDLTRATDRLPAISGIAQSIQHHIADRYLAGHWESSLVKSLCWYVTPMAKIRPRPSPLEYIAPTWSWASPNLPVQFIFWAFNGGPILENPKPIAKLVGHKIIPKGQGPFSQVRHGCIRLSGKMCTITLPKYDPESSRPYHFNLAGWKFSDPIDFSNLDNLPIRYVDLDRQLEYGSRQLRCFQICQLDRLFMPWKKTYGALVLESTEQPDQFKRLGWARLVSTDFEGSEEREIELI